MIASWREGGGRPSPKIADAKIADEREEGR